MAPAQDYKIQTTQNNDSDICPKKGKEQSNIEMDARRKSVNKNYAKAPYNRTSESHETEHAPPPPICLQVLWHHMMQLNLDK